MVCSAASNDLQSLKLDMKSKNDTAKNNTNVTATTTSTSSTTTTVVGESSKSNNVVVWMYNRYTLRWRSVKLVNNPTCLQLYDVQGYNSGTGTSSILGGVLGLSSLESISSSLSSKSTETREKEKEVANYLNFWSNFGLSSSQEKHKQISNSKTSQQLSTRTNSGSGSGSLSGNIRSLLSIVWFGDHSLILLGSRRGNFTLEILSREPLPHSSAPLGSSGEPTSKVVSL